MRNPGTLNSYLKLEAPVAGAVDDFGEEAANSHRFAGHTWAMILDLRGEELLQAQSIDSAITTKITMWADELTKQITNDWVLTHLKEGVAGYYSPMYIIREDPEIGLFISAFCRKKEER